MIQGKLSLDEIRNTIAKIYNALEAWVEFGILWLALLIFLPYAVAIGLFLIFLPVNLFFFGLSSPWFPAVYVFAVMAVVGRYCYGHHAKRPPKEKTPQVEPGGRLRRFLSHDGSSH